MKISNLRIERKDNLSYLMVDVHCSWTSNSNLWLSLLSEYEEWFSTDVYDAFLVFALYPAMLFNEAIEIEGNVSPRLLFNVRNYVQHIVKAYREELHIVDIKVKGTAFAEKKAKHISTGFTGGFDAFTTIIDRMENETDLSRRIDTMIFYNVGSHGGGKKGARELFNNRYNLLKGFPAEKNIPYIQIDTNLFDDFYKFEWEYYIGSLSRCFVILVLQRLVKYHYVSGEFSYREHMNNHMDKYLCNIDEMTECYIYNLLSTESLEIIHEGAQYTRMEKMIKVSKYKPATKYLNVCVKNVSATNDWTATNCSRCLKCARTLKALDIIGRLDDFADVLDVEWYKKNKKKLWLRYLAGESDTDPMKQGVLDYAREMGFKLPSRVEVFAYKIGRTLYHPIWKLRHMK